MKTAITILFVLGSFYLYGQEVTLGFKESGSLKEFSNFFDRICLNKSDTLITSSDSLIKYSILFSSKGEFIDPKHDLIRICNVKDIRKETGIAEVAFLGSVKDSLSHYFRRNSCEAIQTCITHDYWGEPLADSLINILSQPSFWASCITAKEVRFSNKITLHGLFGYKNSNTAFESPAIMSYRNGKYLVVDMMMVTIVGDQTDKGNVITYYLERID